MERMRFKPLVDKLFFMIFIPTLLLLIAITVISALAPSSLLVVIPLDLFVLYFFVSPFFGYVEMRKTSLFIKYGFFMKKDIPYNRIRGVEKKRKFYTESMLSLKNAMEHVDIKYNVFDVTSVSVVGNDKLIELINSIIKK